MTSPDITAIVLAGGASSRFRSDKLAASLDGRPLLHHALEAVGAVADRMVVVIAPEAPGPSVPEGLASRVVIARDTAAHEGPLAGLAAGLAAMGTPVRDEAPRIKAAAEVAEVAEVAAEVEAAAEAAAAEVAAEEAEAEVARDGVVLVVGGDMPALMPRVLRLLAERLVADPSLAVMTLAASDPAPLPMALRPDAARAAIDAILSSGGRRSLLALVDAIPSATLPAEAWRALDLAGATLRDVDVPADLVGG